MQFEATAVTRKEMRKRTKAAMNAHLKKHKNPEARTYLSNTFLSFKSVCTRQHARIMLNDDTSITIPTKLYKAHNKNLFTLYFEKQIGASLITAEQMKQQARFISE